MKKKRRFFPRRRNPAATAERSADPAVEMEARRLADTFPLDRLEDMLAEAQEAHDRADEESQQNPSGPALFQYRSAAKALATAQRAVELASALPVAGN